MNPDWYYEIFSSKKLNSSLEISLSNISHIFGVVKLHSNLGFACGLVYVQKQCFPFFHSDGNEPVLRTSLKTSSNGL